MKEFIVEKNENLKDFTDNVCAQASFYFRQLLKAKEIRVNGKKVGENVSLNAGDVVRYYLTPVQESKTAFLRVYEDENVIVIDKDSGVNSEAVFSALKEEGARFIHRLDRNTRGLMMFAKTNETEKELCELFKTRQIKKVYHALICGVPKSKQATLTAYLKKDADRSTVRVFDHPQSGAETIVTEYKVLEEKGDVCLVEVLLHTGKTHQIRAHFAHIGTPVLGDDKYGNETLNKRYGLTRQCLVAKSLTVFSGGVLSYLNEKTFLSSFDVCI